VYGSMQVSHNFGTFSFNSASLAVASCRRSDGTAVNNDILLTDWLKLRYCTGYVVMDWRSAIL